MIVSRRYAPSFDLAPDWVCEVLSRRTYAKNRGCKLPICAREHVKHGRLVEARAHVLEVRPFEGATCHIVATYEGDDDGATPPRLLGRPDLRSSAEGTGRR